MRRHTIVQSVALLALLLIISSCGAPDTPVRVAATPAAAVLQHASTTSLPERRYLESRATRRSG